MTAIIVGILAALGIGGGFVIANNSGGSSGSGGAAIVQISGEKQDYTANDINPDYSLISAITDTNQYQPSIANDDTFMTQYQSSALQTHLTGTEEDYSIYGDPEDDLRNGLIRGEQIENTPYYTTLNLLRGIGSFYVFSFKYNLNNWGGVQKDIYGSLLTYNDYKPLESVPNRYDTFKIEDASVYAYGNTVVYKHYNAVHLGGAALGLTVADFGHWEEKSWREEGSQKYMEMHNNKTFFFYDERFAYRNRYYKSTATMQGSVLVSTITDHQSVDTAYNLQTGSISMDLDLVSRKITNGQVVMDDSNYAQYNVEGFTGSINGSVFRIDGTGWLGQDVPPEIGQLRGGVGKLLIGKDGLEMVGNFTKQIEYNGEVDDQGRPNYDPGKADYTFGAKEIN